MSWDNVNSFKLVLTNEECLKQAIPTNITSLQIESRNFEGSLSSLNIPKNITKIIISNLIDAIPYSILPSQLELLEFIPHHTQKFPAINLYKLPRSLKLLINVDRIDKPSFIGKLLSGKACEVEDITFSANFNESTETLSQLMSVKSLRSIKFEKQTYSLSMSSYTSLVKLSLGQHFDKPIKVGDLPPNLKFLDLGRLCNSPIEIGALPVSLEELVMSFDWELDIPIGMLPPQLQRLTLGSNFDKPIGKGVLPDSLKKLKLGLRFNSPIILPPNLTHFSKYYFMTQTIDFPPSVIKRKFR
ncbi:phospholipase/carboxylesterase family protein [Tieghemostelium lacteum]|uniref:Phospholipase/carboxylesterase family protein n=1 Tax=Tieghemostelium lacteum TaxID=361077 RepID=A0A151ZF20_TIELA|nr:phospholipase/carboxylesterase family protein [Tieghemostelium lacteum]|eukprot:KYQ92509.1 phospholipase/carboxylesterase family protein [Tieghemostelium lacteum]